MNLREEILKEQSRIQSLKIANWIGRDRKRFNRLINIFLHDEYRAVQRSAHILSFVADEYPEHIRRNIDVIVNRLGDEKLHIAVKRNVVRILQLVDIPHRLHAKVMNFCFEYLSDPNEAIAVRVFSMTVLANLAKQYPEIKNELEAVINTQLKDSKGGLKARARNVLKELAKLGNE